MTRNATHALPQKRGARHLDGSGGPVVLSEGGLDIVNQLRY
jgi:hypothetical protein